MKISFSDFWDGFDPNNNFFTYLLMDTFLDCEVIPPCQKTDLLIYSCFGLSHKQANRKTTKKIFYTGENKKPNYDECDYSLSFDFSSYEGRNIRLPLWMMYIDWFDKTSYGNPNFLLPIGKLKERGGALKDKKFCSIVFSNPTPNRIQMMEQLSRYKKVDNYGRFGISLPGGDESKIHVLSDYKFNICFENQLHPGYYTEKVLQAKGSGCLPIYWADQDCGRDFDQSSFINLNDFKNMDDCIERIVDLDKNEQEYDAICSKYLFEGKEPSLDDIKKSLIDIL